MIPRPARLSRIFHVDRIGRGQGSRHALCLITGIVGFANSEQNHGDRKVDKTGDQGCDPFGPSEEVVRLNLLKVEIHLLEDVLGLKGDHAGFVLELVNGILKLGLGDVFQDPFGVPSPVENLGFGAREDHVWCQWSIGSTCCRRKPWPAGISPCPTYDHADTG